MSTNENVAPFDLNAFLEEHREEKRSGSYAFLELRPWITCADGLTFSAQASHTHYCRPREDRGPYDAVELGYPSEEVPEFMPFAESPEDPTSTVYGYVPVDVVEAVVAARGGFAGTVHRSPSKKATES